MTKEELEEYKYIMSTKELLIKCIKEYYPKKQKNLLANINITSWKEACNAEFEFDYKYGISMSAVISNLNRELYRKRERIIDTEFLWFAKLDKNNKIPEVLPEGIVTVADLEDLTHQRYVLPEDYERD